MRSAGDKLAQQNKFLRYGRNNDNPLKHKTSKHIEKYKKQGFKVQIQDDGLIKVEVLEEHLGSKQSPEDLKLVMDILAVQVETFLMEQGDTGIEKLQKMKMPNAKEIVKPGFSLSQHYGKMMYKQHLQFEKLQKKNMF